MVAGKNYNVQTKLKKIATKSLHATFGTAVPTGMTRYVTCVGVIQDAGGMASAGSRVIFCSTAASNTAQSATAASTAAKLSIGIGSYVTNKGEKNVFLPPGGPDTEHPLFTIAATKWFTAFLCSAAGTSAMVEVFAQWYDQ